MSEELTALGSGRSGFGAETARYNPAILETFENKHRGWPAAPARYLVRLICGEFTSVCPRTGQPDWAELVINYVPAALCVESKSLKLYLNSFREHGAFHEDVCNIIANDLVDLMAPYYLEVLGRFNPRGGIAIYPYAQRWLNAEWRSFAEQRLLEFPGDPGRGPVLR